MLGNGATSNVFRCAWNRFAPHGKPFVGILRNSFSTLNKHGPGRSLRSRAQLLSRPMRDVQSIGKRGIKESAQRSGDNTILFVGLGALSIATLAAVKSNIFSIDGKPKTTTVVTEPNVTEINETEEAAVSEEGEHILNENEDTEHATVEAKEELEVKQSSNEENKALAEDSSIVAEEEEALLSVELTHEGVPNENAAEKKPEIEGTVSSEAKEAEATETAAEQKQETGVNIEEISKQPPVKELPKIPTYAPYVIVGGGTASHAACRAIRKHDPTAKILVIGEEEVLPYMRPPLSKELWFSEDEDAADTLYFKQWNGKRRSVFFEDDTYYVKPQHLPSKENGGVSVLTGHKVIEVDAVKHTVHLKNGSTIQYDKLLIATGGHPKNTDLFTNSSDDLKRKVTLFRTVADYRKLEKLIGSLDSVAIIGGGFLGSELACALGSRGKKTGIQVSQIYHESGNMGKVLPKYLSEWTTRKVESEGVKIYPNSQPVKADLLDDGKVSIELHNGEKVDAGHVIVCVGIEANTDLAKSAGLEVDPELGGFRVNSELQARSDIWVAGDAACFYDVRLGRRRVEHHDHAVVSGRLAGQNMTGAKKSYLHQSMFWSDLGPEVGYEAIGIVDNTLDTVGIWAKATKEDSPKAVVEATGENLRSQTEEDAETGESLSVPATEVSKPNESSEEYGKGVVFYLKDQVVVGVLLWNVFNKMPVARKILKEGNKQDSLVELAKLFNIHE